MTEENRDQAVAAEAQPAEAQPEAAQPAVEAEQGGDGQEKGEEQPPPEKRKRGRDDPVVLAYCKFHAVEELVQYFRTMLQAAPRNADMNEYEHLALLALLKQHPEWDKKAGTGIKSFQVREIDVPDGKARAFVAVRKDGSVEDFSYIKCAGQLYPGEVSQTPGGHKKPRHDDRGGRGRGGGWRGGGNNRGGRGRGGGNRGRGGRR